MSTQIKIMKRTYSKHGMTDTKLHYIWRAMKQRCNNVNNKRYKDYGGRNISYDKSWESFVNFYNDVKDTYKEGLSLDRIDNNKGYSKENCRWATSTEQANNQTRNIIIRYNKKSLNIKQWSDLLDINYATLYYRVSNNFPLNKMFSKTYVTRPAKKK